MGYADWSVRALEAELRKLQVSAVKEKVLHGKVNMETARNYDLVVAELDWRSKEDGTCGGS